MGDTHCSNILISADGNHLSKTILFGYFYLLSLRNINILCEIFISADNYVISHVLQFCVQFNNNLPVRIILFIIVVLPVKFGYIIVVNQFDIY